MKYLSSLYLYLSVYKSALLTKYNHNSFDTLNENYRCSGVTAKMSKLCKNSGIAKDIFLMLNELYKCIKFKLIQTKQIGTSFNASDISKDIENNETDNYVNQSLEILLTADENYSENFNILNYDLNGLLGKHAYETWKLYVEIFFNILTEKATKK